MGYLRLTQPQRDNSLDLGAVQSWTVVSGTQRRAVVLTGTGSSATIPAAARWIVEPIPVIQLGLAPARTPTTARIVAGEYRTGTWEQALGVSRTLFEPISRQPGFCGTIVALAPDGMRTFSISLWDDGVGPTVGVDTEWFNAQVAKFSACYVAPPETFAGELA